MYPNDHVSVLRTETPLTAPARRVRRCPLRGLVEFAGFTLVELLVVLAILALVLSALLPVLSRMRTASERAREIAAARELVGAWQQYAQDSNGAVLPGYKSGLPAYDADRNPIATQTIGVTANRWVWRLAPYIGHNFDALYLGEHERVLRELETTDISNYLYQTSVFPSFGLNSVWVGGDENYGGFSSAFLGLYGKFYVTRLSEIAQPASLILGLGPRRTTRTIPRRGEISADEMEARSSQDLRTVMRRLVRQRRLTTCDSGRTPQPRRIRPSRPPAVEHTPRDM